MVLLGTAVVLGGVVAYSYLTARHLLEEEMVGRVRQEAAAVANQVETIQAAVQKLTEGVAVVMQVAPPDQEETLYRLLEGSLGSNAGLMGATVASAPGETVAGRVDGGVSVARQAQGFTRTAMETGAASFRISDSYLLATVLDKPQWTEPYYGEGSAEVLATYAVPFYVGGTDGQPRRLGGVVTCDVSLDWLANVMANLDLGKDGYGFIISRNATFISHPVRTMIMRETVFSIAEARGDLKLRADAQKMIRGETGISSLVALATGLDSFMAYTPIPSTGWSVVLMLPKQEVLSKVLSLSRTEAIAGGAGLFLLMIAAYFIALGIARPVARLSAATHALADDLDATLPEPKGHDEVAELGRSFARMRDQIKRHMAELAAATAAKERIESELRLAADIQQSLIPKTFPPFPNLPDIDIFALLEPAREIGGDFYDFFFLDEQRICFAVADVSGKGVPAALFMVATRSFLRSLMREEKSAAKAFDRLNIQLEEGNDACMFVTIFCGVIDLSTGRCTYANAGHNLPLQVASDGTFSVIDGAKGVILGVDTSIRYDEGEFTLPVGDCLILYTDGVTEAMDENELQFGDARLREVTVGGAGGDCRQHVANIRQAVTEFIGEAEQSDDITLLVIRRIEGERTP